jgi:thymidylate synthase
MKSYSNFTHAYHGIIRDVYNYPDYICSPRALKIKEKLGYSFRINDIKDRLPYVPHRKFSVAYMVAELLWYLAGSNSTKWISKYSSMWQNISDDGSTANSAYGSRIFSMHKYQSEGSNPALFSGWSQWRYVKEELTRDPDSRRAVIHIRMPQDSLLASKDVPCTLTLQYFLRANALHQVVSMRSSDVVLGISYDVPAFTFIQEMLANQLGVDCGSYTHVSNSMHIYEKHFDMCEKIIDQPFVDDIKFKCKRMNSIPAGDIPIKELLGVEHDLWNKQDIVVELQKLESSNLDQYWKDWLCIIARFICQKKGDLQLVEHINSQIRFSGFRNFEK